MDEIARKLKRHRLTIEKHLRVLLAAKIVEKVSSLSKSGHLMIRYEIWENAEELLARIEEASQTSKLLRKLDSGLLRH